jgi:hypothetical protein
MKIALLQKETGTIAPLVAAYLALTLFVILGSASVGTALIAKNRIQGVNDQAVLFGHDQSITRGVPNANGLAVAVENFLATANSAKRIKLYRNKSWVTGEVSHLELCGSYQNLFGIGVSSGVICTVSSAKSFLVP